jgi:acyl transferase domain-containing protein
MNKFDAEFFGISEKLSNTLDPLCRVLLEKVFETAFDAGVNPSALRGTKTGVYVGSSCTPLDNNIKLEGYEFLLISRAAIPNRVSFHYDLKGKNQLMKSLVLI